VHDQFQVFVIPDPAQFFRQRLREALLIVDRLVGVTGDLLAQMIRDFIRRFFVNVSRRDFVDHSLQGGFLLFRRKRSRRGLGYCQRD
jgi:hypothetical protein